MKRFNPQKQTCIDNMYAIAAKNTLTDDDIEFCRHAMYFRNHYLSQSWMLEYPVWMQDPIIEHWMLFFTEKYEECKQLFAK